MSIRGSDRFLAIAHPHEAIWAVPLRTRDGQLHLDLLRLVAVLVIWIGLPLLGLMAAVRASAWLGVGAATMVVLLFAVLVIPLGMSAWAELVGPALSYHRLRADQLGVALDVLHCSRALVPSELPERAGRGGWRVSWEQVAEVDRQKGRVVVRTHEGEIHQLPVVPYELSEQLIRSLMHVVRARRSAAEPEAAAAARQEALRQLIAAAS